MVEELNVKKQARDAKVQLMGEDEITETLSEIMDVEDLKERASKLEELNKKVFERQPEKVDILKALFETFDEIY